MNFLQKKILIKSTIDLANGSTENAPEPLSVLNYFHGS